MLLFCNLIKEDLFSIQMTLTVASTVRSAIFQKSNIYTRLELLSIWYISPFALMTAFTKFCNRFYMSVLTLMIWWTLMMNPGRLNWSAIWTCALIDLTFCAEELTWSIWTSYLKSDLEILPVEDFLSLFSFFKISFLFPIFWEKIPDSSCALRL